MKHHRVILRISSALLMLQIAACVAMDPPRGPALDASAWGRERAQLSTRLAFDALQRGEGQRAEQLLDDALGQDPRHVPALALRTRLAHENCQVRDGLRFARAWLEVAPNDGHALRYLGLFADASGDHADAERYLLEAQKHAIGDTRASFDLYLHYLAEGREAEAEQVLSGVLPARGQAAPLVQGAAWYLQQGRGEQALAAYREARRRSPDDHAVAGHLAVGAWSMGRHAEVLEIGAELPPRARLEHPDLPLVLASSRLEQGDFSGALSELDLVPTSLHDVSFLTLRGEVLLALGAAERACEAFAAATSQRDAPLRAWLGYGRAALQSGLALEALRALRQAERLGASSPNLPALIAAAHAVLEEHAEARAALERARRAGADPAVIAEVEDLMRTELSR